MGIPALRMRKLSLRARAGQEQVAEDAEDQEWGRGGGGGWEAEAGAPQLRGPCRKCEGPASGASPGPRTQPHRQPDLVLETTWQREGPHVQRVTLGAEGHHGGFF